jgi:hypothetical protein
MRQTKRRIREATVLIALVVLAAAGASGAGGATAASWLVVASPNVGAGENTLLGVTALSPTDAWAVGELFEPGAGVRPLIERWDGTSWTVTPSPTTGAGASLSAVAAISTTDVWAVGRFHVEGTSESDGRTLVQHWDGSEWTIVPSPNAGLESRGNGTLAGVFALASDDVWAVGSHFPREKLPTLQPLIEHWDGEEWEVVPGPSESPGPWSELSDISGTSPSDLWAVGGRDADVGEGGTERALILHWDGVEWTRVPVPLPAGRLTPFRLQEVAAVSPTNAWAVGVVATARRHRTLVMHWDGDSWKVAPSASPSQQFQDLLGVAALSASRVWAVGTYYDRDAKRMRTLVERWDGERFRQVSSGNRGSSELRDVAAAPGARFAVGVRGESSFRTLVLQSGAG